MNKERLITLADWVDKNVKEKEFDMRRFFSYDVNELSDLTNKCGTTACLAGWAAVIPEFARAGYHVENMNSVFVTGLTIVYDGADGFNALGKFFDLDEEQVDYIFGEYDDRDETITRDDDSPSTATARIRQFVADGKCNWQQT